jgi:hypothetical protein
LRPVAPDAEIEIGFDPADALISAFPYARRPDNTPALEEVLIAIDLSDIRFQ